MPLAIASILCANIIIFQRSPSIPRMYVPPPNYDSKTLTLFIVYDSNGGGHYHAALLYNQTQAARLKQNKKQLSCNCGVNSSDKEIKSCVPLQFSNTRCKCFKISHPCSRLCRCKNCENTFGKRITNKQMSRKRTVHSLQVKIPTSKKFAVEKGEDISTALWSEFETIAILKVLKHLESNSEGDDDITKIYNDVVYYSKSLFCTLHLPEGAVFRNKTSTQIRCKLQHISKSD